MMNQRDFGGRYGMGYQTAPMPRSACPSTVEKKGTTQTVCADALLLQIDRYSFAMDDTRLYLDTHPDCEEANLYFSKLQKLRTEAIKKYEETTGSLLAYQTSAAGCTDWSWNEGPLPWENQCCNGRRV